MKDIYYVNSNNEKIDLLEPPYMLQTGELFGSKWSYESKQRLGGGGKITNIRKEPGRKNADIKHCKLWCRKL
mgnify:CR=1 FL=1